MRSIHAPAILLASGLAAACAGEPQPAPEYPPVDEPTTEVEVTGEPTEGGETEAAEAPPPAAPVQVVAGERTPIEGDAPSIRVPLPRHDKTTKRTPIRVRVLLKNWELGKDPGNHVHLIYDNEPYIAIRDVSQPLNLNELVEDNLHLEVEPGTHVLRLFPSRGHHESVKTDGAFAAVVFHFEKKKGLSFEADKPFLTYSRPKGCNKLGERVMIDFYVSNVEELSAEGHRVAYALDDSVKGEITSWTPHFIENLTEGEHKLELKLLGPDGKVVEGPFNDTTRTFEVSANCEGIPITAPEEGGDDA